MEMATEPWAGPLSDDESFVGSLRSPARAIAVPVLDGILAVGSRSCRGGEGELSPRPLYPRPSPGYVPPCDRQCGDLDGDPEPWGNPKEGQEGLAYDRQGDVPGERDEVTPNDEIPVCGRAGGAWCHRRALQEADATLPDEPSRGRAARHPERVLRWPCRSIRTRVAPWRGAPHWRGERHQRQRRLQPEGRRPAA